MMYEKDDDYRISQDEDEGYDPSKTLISVGNKKSAIQEKKEIADTATDIADEAKLSEYTKEKYFKDLETIKQVSKGLGQMSSYVAACKEQAELAGLTGKNKREQTPIAIVFMDKSGNTLPIGTEEAKKRIIEADFEVSDVGGGEVGYNPEVNDLDNDLDMGF